MSYTSRSRFDLASRTAARGRSVYAGSPHRRSNVDRRAPYCRIRGFAAHSASTIKSSAALRQSCSMRFQSSFETICDQVGACRPFNAACLRRAQSSSSCTRSGCERSSRPPASENLISVSIHAFVCLSSVGIFCLFLPCATSIAINAAANRTSQSSLNGARVKNTPAKETMMSNQGKKTSCFVGFRPIKYSCSA